MDGPFQLKWKCYERTAWCLLCVTLTLPMTLTMEDQILKITMSQESPLFNITLLVHGKNIFSFIFTWGSGGRSQGDIRNIGTSVLA